jgi:hypothetical protein
MKTYEIQHVIDALVKNLNESEKMWEEKEPHATIIGYLQGTIKGVVNVLEAKVKETK